MKAPASVRYKNYLRIFIPRAMVEVLDRHAEHENVARTDITKRAIVTGLRVLYGENYDADHYEK